MAMPMMRHIEVRPYTFSDMITQGYPFHYKIDPFRLKRASEQSLSYTQLEIDFGKEFEVPYEAKQSRFDRRIDIVTCVVCKNERELFDRLPFEYDGLDIILSPYSEVYGEVCLECFNKHNGWEIIRLSDRRQLIKEEVQKSITVWENRMVLVEKQGYVTDADTGGVNFR